MKNVIQHPAVKFNSVCKGNYWGSLMWILTQQVNYLSYVVHSSNTWEKWKYTEAVHHLFVDFKKAHYSVGRYTIFSLIFVSP